MRLIGHGNRCHRGDTRRTVNFPDFIKMLANSGISRVDTVAVRLGPEEPVPLQKMQSVATDKQALARIAPIDGLASDAITPVIWPSHFGHFMFLSTSGRPKPIRGYCGLQ